MKILRSKIVKPKNKHKSDIQSPVDETAKYPIKDTDYMTDDEEKADEEAFSIIAFWNWERRNYFIKNSSIIGPFCGTMNCLLLLILKTLF
ncbi:hypothetical protein UF69_0317 [Staphylococcus haemolyticus]|nr:hypothetical protein [Staphylococcus haemolyticus]KKI59191.1 hypothetical protein UF69_0317 [Staphylococcus haemolyticus]